MKKLNDLFYSFLQVAASTQKLGIHLIRISILIIFVWIGGKSNICYRFAVEAV